MVEWTVNDGQQIPLSSRVSISRTYALTPAIFASMLSITPLLMGDSNTYTCQVFFRSVVESSAYLSTSDKVSDSHQLSVDGEFSYPFLHYNINVAVHICLNCILCMLIPCPAELSIPITLTTEHTSVPSVAPYNTFRLTCEADVPGYLDSIPFEFQWIRETGPEQEQPVSPDSTTSIFTSNAVPVSILTATRTTPGQYVYYCKIQYLYGEEVVAYAFSTTNGVTVTGTVKYSIG